MKSKSLLFIQILILRERERERSRQRRDIKTEVKEAGEGRLYQTEQRGGDGEGNNVRKQRSGDKEMNLSEGSAINT